ncbi:hypothetical protein AB0C14_37580 [Microbispora hainanensis]|uniref:hypothetical protein n=1 Tax=Microbispora hainanensis TaxID=568844 RepID=UPI0033DADABA
MADETTVTDNETGPEQHSEELRFNYNGGDTSELAQHLTGRSLSARLPTLVRRSFSLAWAVDRRSTIALLACQVVSGLLEALGLFATTTALSALIQSAQDPAQLRAAVPSVAILGGAAGLRAVLGIAIQSLSHRLAPRISREAEYRMLEAATNAEMPPMTTPASTTATTRPTGESRSAAT